MKHKYRMKMLTPKDKPQEQVFIITYFDPNTMYRVAIGSGRTPQEAWEDFQEDLMKSNQPMMVYGILHWYLHRSSRMIQLYVRLSGEVLVGRSFIPNRWYPVTVHESHDYMGNIVDEEGQPYLLDLYRLPKNPAWVSHTVDVSFHAYSPITN